MYFIKNLVDKKTFISDFKSIYKCYIDVKSDEV